LKFISNFKRIRDWIKQKLPIDQLIYRRLPGFQGDIFFSHHHESHAASAFYPSPFESAAILVVDAMGEWSCSSIGQGDGNKISILKEQHFPHSVGLLYSAITQHVGFKVHSGEYKVMGLAPYGEPKFVKLIKDHLVEIKEDGSIILNTDYFDFMIGKRMTNAKMEELFNAPDRKPESPISQREMDVAKSIQVVVEEIILKMVQHAVDLTGFRNLSLAGGVALNCVANGKIQRSGLIDGLWIQPAAGDAGGALGAALLAHYKNFEKNHRKKSPSDSQKGSFLGPIFTEEEVKNVLDAYGFIYQKISGKDIFSGLTDLIIEGNVIGLFQGSMEFGPRALGARSIIGDARNPIMQRHMNKKIKYRESFRPFAPVVLVEEFSEWFEGDSETPYMLLTTQVNSKKLIKHNDDRLLFGIEKLNVVRSEIPAVTHVDNSARVQTVDKERNSFLHELLQVVKAKTGCPVLINTSFNIRGEPIVCTPLDALRCFMNTEIDYLFIERFLLNKKQQKNQLKDDNFKNQKELD
jgi:carbamoyltransferase